MGRDGSPRYTPTPEEIRAVCQLIQAGWSERTECDRRMIQNRPADMSRPHAIRISNRGLPG